MRISTFILDTFTSLPFRGNPTGVCHTNENLPEKMMLSIARELNFPVTAFIKADNTGVRRYHIQYFTPVTQIPACGHATLGAAATIFETGVQDAVQFQTVGGIIIPALLKEGLVTMTYPKYEMKETIVNGGLLESLHINSYASSGYCEELETLFIELDDPALLRNIQPDYVKLVASDTRIKEVVITSLSDTTSYDFLLRSFCPWIGINEDPVTGSVHSVLAGFWKNRLMKNTLKAYQASGRGGEISVTSLGDKVELGGNCVMQLKGEFLIAVR
jgi:PhzF family phenazine biosynthesis protein